MVQLRIVAGKLAGTRQNIRRFPCVIGRSASAHWRLEDAGIWDQHLRLDLEPREGFTATVIEGALATLNGAPLKRAVLHNGDVLECGAAKIQFWLGQTRQRNFQWRETLTWIGLAILSGGQIFLIYQL